VDVFISPHIIWIIVGIGIILFFIVYKKGDSLSGSTLELFSKDLTKLAKEKKLDPVIDREEEINRTIQILSRRAKNNVVLIGKAGVGKTAIVEGLAQRIVEGKVPQELLNKRVLALDISQMVAGTKYRGEFEQRLKRIMREITLAKRIIILFIDEIHVLVSAGGAEGAIKAEDIFKPALARGDLQMIGATTFSEYDQYIKKDVTLERRFQPIHVFEPDLSTTKKILLGIKNKYEKFHNVKITNEAIDAAISLAKKYITDRNFPDKAIDLIDEAASKVKLDTIGEEKTKKKPKVTLRDIKTVIKYYKKTGGKK